jgi:hypothetical protein
LGKKRFAPLTFSGSGDRIVYFHHFCEKHTDFVKAHWKIIKNELSFQSTRHGREKSRGRMEYRGHRIVPFIVGHISSMDTIGEEISFV